MYGMHSMYLLIALIILLFIAVVEVWNPKLMNEGFANLVSVGDSAMWQRWMPRRGDVGLNAMSEQDGYIRDIRYFAGYTDVQRLGQDHDFCRMIHTDGDPTDMFFACALGGTEGLSTVKFRTPSSNNGFELSRDDYMNDLGEGRKGYCRILKTSADTFEAKCNPVTDTSFKANIITDPTPPKDIEQLLQFYEGIVFWLRMKDDLLDYAKNLTISGAGMIEIQELPEPTTKGLEFNGVDQFLKIGDTTKLTFGDVVQLKYLRAVSFWVYFEEFTNNAKIFDFGDRNQSSVFCGIIGRGNMGMQQSDIQHLDSPFIDESQKTIPDEPSGQQCTLEQSPEIAMLTSSADINQYDCPSPEIFGRIMKPLHTKVTKAHDAKTADLLYEIWESKNRKLHIQVKNVFPLRKWVHIAITATTGDAFRPDIKIYKDGKVVYTEKGAWLPQTNYTSQNYIGKSNTMDASSQYDNKDELFKGKMFDFRGYRTPMNEKKVEATVNWGKTLLNIDDHDTPFEFDN